MPYEDDRHRVVRFVDRFVWPRIHGKWWNFDYAKGRTKTLEEIYEDLRSNDLDQAKETLEHVELIAQGAVDRGAAADRRASTIAGTVAIAASFTLSGGSLALDGTKLTDPTARTWFAIGLCVTTVGFVLSALYALGALVATRVWLWSDPHDLPSDPGESREMRIGMRAAHLLAGYAGNWEISDVKNRLVDLALRWLIVALAAMLVLAVLLATQVA
ncbi:MAG: hypothetical protein QOH76_784 [Thermoleophilaceae bacterium]|nr:hypothetical protein [Thermoleophilaceae bacterium]